MVIEVFFNHVMMKRMKYADDLKGKEEQWRMIADEGEGEGQHVPGRGKKTLLPPGQEKQRNYFLVFKKMP